MNRFYLHRRQTTQLNYGKIILNKQSMASTLTFLNYFRIFDSIDGGERLLRIREGNAAPPTCIKCKLNANSK